MILTYLKGLDQLGEYKTYINVKTMADNIALQTIVG